MSIKVTGKPVDIRLIKERARKLGVSFIIKNKDTLVFDSNIPDSLKNYVSGVLKVSKNKRMG